MFARKPVGPIGALPIENQMNEDLWWYQVHASRNRAAYRASRTRVDTPWDCRNCRILVRLRSEVSIVLGLLVSLVAGLQAVSGAEGSSVRFWRTFGMLRSEWSAGSNDAGPYFDVRLDRDRKQALATQRWNAIVDSEYRAWEVAGKGRENRASENRD